MFTPLVGSCDGQLSTQNVEMAMYGLQNMRSDYSEVLQLLPLLKSYNGILPAQTVGMALLGLSNCDVLDCKLSVINAEIFAHLRAE